MTDSLSHRGPDAEGYWDSAHDGVALGHRRLSIIDLSDLGKQPMSSPSGRYVIVYNGEIYNYREIRRDLDQRGVSFRGESDTEVLIAAIDEFGIVEACRKANGMFAFAVWDKEERRLSLARDRIGIKPLYYGWGRSSFLFGSELKCFHKHPDFHPVVSKDVLALYFRHNYVPGPYSIFENVYRLAPGSVLSLELRDCYQKPESFSAWPEASPISCPISYWSVKEAERQLPFQGSFKEACWEAESLLLDSVSKRMIADVPLGAFLSGGIDSSLVVALMQEQSHRPVRTFSIGFREEGFDESPYARSVAEHLGTDHTELYVSASEAQEVIPELPKIWDEPFSDSSQIPTLILARLTRESVTVSLSGDGGDEAFMGYTRYHVVPLFWRCMSLCPFALRKPFTQLIQSAPTPVTDSLMKLLSPILPNALRLQDAGEKLRRASELFQISDRRRLYQELVSHFRNPEALVLGAQKIPTAFDVVDMGQEKRHYISEMSWLDLESYLPDDILVKVDRATMDPSLEARVPLLDHRVIEFCRTLPMKYHVKSGVGKRILRTLLTKRIPQNHFERPKKGFSIPIHEWLRGPLREWAEELLDSTKIKNEGTLNAELISTLWKEHLSEKRNNGSLLWDILMYLSWRHP